MHIKLTVGARTKSGPSDQRGEARSHQISSRWRAPIFSKNGQKISEIKRNIPSFLQFLAKILDISSVDISLPSCISPTPERHPTFSTLVLRRAVNEDGHGSWRIGPIGLC